MALVVAAIVLAALAVLTVAAWRRRRAEGATRERMAVAASQIRDWVTTFGVPKPGEWGTPRCCSIEFRETLVARDWNDHDSTPVLDAWGRALRLQAPGPVHEQGWDVWSVGPDGIDDHGGGDDILVGEDVASVSTRGE